MSNNYFNYNEIQLRLLHSLYGNPELIPQVGQEITSDDFDNELYQVIFKSMSDLKTENEVVTLGTIYQRALKYNYTITPEILNRLISDIPPESPIVLAKIVKRQSTQQKAREILNEVNNQLAQDNPDTLEILGRTERSLSELANKLVPMNLQTFEDYVSNYGEHILSEDEEEIDVIQTPYPSLAKYLGGGWKPSQLITIGARTGIGKSVFATQTASAACASGRSVLFFSLEMGKDELMNRFIAADANVILNKLVPGAKGRVPEEVERIKESIERIKNWKIRIEDQPDVTIEHIRSIALSQAQTPDGLDLIILDYLQLINPGNTGRKSRQEQVAEISRNMKILAKQLKVPIMVLVQLNRESKDDDEERLPSKADIRESGAIAADSDVIVIIHRKYRDDSVNPSALFILDKNRGGAADRRVSVKCVLEKSMFVDNGGVTEDEQSEADEVLTTKEELTEEDFDELGLDTYSDEEDFFGEEFLDDF